AQEPLPLALHVDDAVAGPARWSTIRRNHFRNSVLDGDIRRHETERLAFDPQLQALVFPEVLCESLLDGFPSLQVTAGFVRVIAVGRPEGGERSGIALMERLHEGFAIPLDSCLVLGIAFDLPGGPQPNAIRRAVRRDSFDGLRVCSRRREKIDADAVAACNRDLLCLPHR